VLSEALATGGEVAKRAFEAMMPMQKIDVAAIEAAAQGSR
jgi:predicted 3-demethylubiquinone-9 3-methyltransferase (glyoxalase superfamily)